MEIVVLERKHEAKTKTKRNSSALIWRGGERDLSHSEALRAPRAVLPCPSYLDLHSLPAKHIHSAARLTRSPPSPPPPRCSGTATAPDRGCSSIPDLKKRLQRSSAGREQWSCWEGNRQGWVPLGHFQTGCGCLRRSMGTVSSACIWPSSEPTASESEL